MFSAACIIKKYIQTSISSDGAWEGLKISLYLLLSRFQKVFIVFVLSCCTSITHSELLL